MNKVGNSQDHREACGGDRQRPVPGHRLNPHKVTKASEPVQLAPADAFNSYRTPHQTKRPCMPNSAPLEDTEPPGPPGRALDPLPQVCPVASSTRPTASAYPRCQAPPPGTQGFAWTPDARPRRMSAPCTQARAEHVCPACTRGAGPGNRVFCIWQPCARDSGNKTAVSAHGMGSGGLAVDAMAIRMYGCGSPW